MTAAALAAGRAVARLPLRFGLLLTLAVLSLFNLQLIIRALPIGYPVSDYRFPEAAAHAVFAHGWSHVYDTALPNPPPLVWLVAPFAVLPGPLGYALWSMVMLACLVASALMLAGLGWVERLQAVTIVLALLPAMAIVIYGQPAALVFLALALGWYLARAGRQAAAGAVLALAVVKPHLLLLVPFTLLLAGHRRLFAGWILTCAILALASLLTLGPATFIRYGGFMLHFNGGHTDYSLSLVIGSQPLLAAVRLAVIAIALLIGWLSRGQGPTIPMAAGTTASLLASGYLNAFDLALYAALLLMLLREDARLRPAVIAGALIWIATEVAISEGLLIVLLEVGFLVLLLGLALDWRAHFGDLWRSGRKLG